MNCFLYADDVLLIFEKAQMLKLLKICEDYSFSLSFLYNLSKCVVLSDMNDDLSYELYRHTSLNNIPSRILKILLKHVVPSTHKN